MRKSDIRVGSMIFWRRSLWVADRKINGDWRLRALGDGQFCLLPHIQDEELAFLRSTYEAHIRLRWRQLGRKSDLGADGRQLEFEWAKEPAGGELVA